VLMLLGAYDRADAVGHSLPRLFVVFAGANSEYASDP
jgi:hypothetical protein